MELKQYQERVIADVERYLNKVTELRESENDRHAALDAWRAVGLSVRYNERENGLGEDLPNFCIKVPTGGGKTVIATQILGSVYRTILKDRNGSGLVLWVVPSSQIYRDTLKRLRDRDDWYRLMLEHAISRRIEVWEKHEIARLSPARLRECLNILVIQLASTNRETKEQLKFFRDSGGNIVQHFPPEDDPQAHKALKEQTRNLDMIIDDDATRHHLVATSVGNMVRLCRPAVILDEGHKATSALAQRTIETFNATIVVELSATPHKGANVVSRVSGQELLDEQMIKLPLNIATSGQKNWKDALTQARDKRLALLKKAQDHAANVGPDRLIRPIVLVQAERTGKDQRGAKVKGQLVIHSEDVREYLLERLGVAGSAIAVKTSTTDELIEHADLLDTECPIEWIITKSALQEGWDCPFAYILVSLNNTGSGQSMTQLIGRILRQPYQESTPYPELNESYVYCLHRRASEIAREVKCALEKEGYEGDAASIVDASHGPVSRPQRLVRIRPEFSRLYTKPFSGKIYLPHFCVKNGREIEALDYFRHLVSAVDVDRFPFDSINWPMAEALRDARDRFYRITIGEELRHEYETETDLLETDTQVIAWLVASLPFDYLSHKQLGRVVQRVYERLVAAELQLKGRLGLVKFTVRDHVERFIKEQLDAQTERAFSNLFERKKLLFYLQCAECRFEIPESITIQPTRKLMHDDQGEIAKSLFDYVEHESANEYERAVALCIDKHPEVLWWYRNLVGTDQFAIQGYRRHKIRPDFVVQNQHEGRTLHRVLVIESKGVHLEGNPDTAYKRKVARYFSEVGKKVTWQQLGEDFKDHIFRFQILDEAQDLGRDWRDELTELLSSPV